MKEEVRTLQRENEQDMGFDGIWRVIKKEEPEIAIFLVAVRRLGTIEYSLDPGLNPCPVSVHSSHMPSP